VDLYEFPEWTSERVAEGNPNQRILGILKYPGELNNSDKFSVRSNNRWRLEKISPAGELLRIFMVLCRQAAQEAPVRGAGPRHH
jgi:hypothetical protein